MKRLILLFALTVLLALPLAAQGPVGDIVLWLPDASHTRQTAQIQRNSQYVSIKLVSLYAFYRSGFFENIRSIVIKSGVTLDSGGGRTADGEMVNKVWAKSRQSGDFMAINDHLVALSPASPERVVLKVSFGGVGEDRFATLFSVLSGSDLKAPLQLTDAALGKISGITTVVRKFFATPYTTSNPAQMLDVSTSLVLYNDRNSDRVDSLREGYFVVVSGREKKSADLGRVLDLLATDPSGFRLVGDGQALMYRAADESWRRFDTNSYVVFSVTQTPVKGEDTHSAWYMKYSTAEDKCREVALKGRAQDQVWAEARELWNEGNILLSADASYIDDERDKISWRHFEKIKTALTKWVAASGRSLAGLDLSGVPQDVAERAAAYERLLASNAGSIVVKVPAAASAGSTIQVHGAAQSAVATVDQTGTATIENLVPGTYTVQSDPGIISGGETISVAPKEKTEITLPPITTQKPIYVAQ